MRYSTIHCVIGVFALPHHQSLVTDTQLNVNTAGPRVPYCIRLLNSTMWRIQYTKHELDCMGKPLR